MKAVTMVPLLKTFALSKERSGNRSSANTCALFKFKEKFNRKHGSKNYHKLSSTVA